MSSVLQPANAQSGCFILRRQKHERLLLAPKMMQEEDNKAEKFNTAVYYAANSCHIHNLNSSKAISESPCASGISL